MMEFDALLAHMVREDASDMILKTGGHPSIRIDGTIKYMCEESILPEYTHGVVMRILDEDLYERFMRDGEVDAVFVLDGIGRFRVNVYRQNGEVGMVFRYIKDTVATFEELALPTEQLKRLSGMKRGMILATGVAGSGKSTTLAAIVEHINCNYGRHIITIEDPIEYVFEDQTVRSINQREIGTRFTPSFAQATASTGGAPVPGRDPDRRDAGSSETVDGSDLCGRDGSPRVQSTLHTVNAVQTVERIISLYPPHQHELVRLQLAMVLEGVMSLRLLPRADGRGRVPAVELMINTPSIKESLIEGRTKEIEKYVEEGEYYGSQTFNQSLRILYEAGAVSYDDAIAASDHPEELALAIRGISRGSIRVD